MASTIYTIFAGSAASASVGPTLLGTAAAGTAGAKRILTYPAPAVGLPPIVYPIGPNQTTNLDNTVLLSPTVQTRLTLSTRNVNFQAGNLSDALITEEWAAVNGVSMPTFFFRLLYEYFVNPPPFDAVNPTFITWAPADRNAKVYNVILVSLTTDSRDQDPTHRYNVRDQILAGGVADGGDTQHAMDDFDAAGGGLMNKSVFLQMKIVGEV